MKEIQMLRDSKDKQIEELKVMIDEASEAAKTEYDAKVKTLVDSLPVLLLKCSVFSKKGEYDS